MFMHIQIEKQGIKFEDQRRENEALQEQLSYANYTIAEKDGEIENLQHQLTTANEIIESLRIQTKTYTNGDVYVGQMKDGKQHGNGKMVYVEDEDDEHYASEVYEGEWKDGNFHGKGTYTDADGDVYDGDWKDDKRNGKGTNTWASGSVYVGDFKDDYINGKGTLHV